MTNRLRGIKEDARSRRFEDVVRCGKLKHDPEKWVPVFRKRSCSDKSIERDDDSKKSHPALGYAAPVNGNEKPADTAGLRQTSMRLLMRESGAGEGARTLDPDLGKFGAECPH